MKIWKQSCKTLINKIKIFFLFRPFSYKNDTATLRSSNRAPSIISKKKNGEKQLIFFHRIFHLKILTYCKVSISFFRKSYNTTILTTNFGKFNLANVTEFIS